ncbi:hypothetical protein [Escherichia coli]|uniref:hypothetical protein n=1 Tax=Escherichia coli TaxID=562 RepID=UPI0013DEB94D|nr:hypothetical protein [Escherichia coli]
MQAIGFIVYIVVGLFQLAAIMAGLLFFGGIIFAIVCGGMSSFFEWLSFRKGT